MTRITQMEYQWDQINTDESSSVILLGASNFILMLPAIELKNSEAILISAIIRSLFSLSVKSVSSVAKKIKLLFK